MNPMQNYYLVSHSFAVLLGTLHAAHLDRFFELIEGIPKPHRKRYSDWYYLSAGGCVEYADRPGTIDRHSVFRFVSAESVLSDANIHDRIKFFEEAEAKRLSTTQRVGNPVDAIQYCAAFSEKMKRKDGETPSECEHRTIRIIRKILDYITRAEIG